MMRKYLLADVDKLRAACLDGDLQAAMKIRDEMLVFDTEFDVDARSWVYHSDKSLCESLLLSAASLRFEICRWLLRGEKGMWLPDDLVRTLDDVLYNAREKIDLRVVRLLVNALRHKKGRHRHDYLLRLATHGSSTLPLPYLVLNRDVVDYLVKCSLEYRAGVSVTTATRSLAEEGENISILLLGILGRKTVPCQVAQHEAEIGVCLAQILRNNGMDPYTVMAPHFWLSRNRNRNKTQISVALHMGWVDRSWLVVAEMLLYHTCPRDDIFEKFIKSMDFSQLTGSLALRIMKLVLVSDLDHRILDIFVAGLGEELDASLTGMLLDFIMGHRYHDPLMTRFAMEHASRSWSSSRSQQAVTLAIRAHSKVAPAVFYQQRTIHPHCFADPHSVTRMLTHGPQTLVYAVVWETNATLVQLMSGLFVCASSEGRLPGQRVCWVKEMYNLRVVLRQRGQKQSSFVRFGSTPPFPHRVAFTVLQFGWLGETMSF